MATGPHRPDLEAVTVLLTTVVVLGEMASEGIPPSTVSILLSVAGAPCWPRLATTVMPDVCAEGKPWNVLVTAGGFLMSFALACG